MFKRIKRNDWLDAWFETFSLIALSYHLNALSAQESRLAVYKSHEVFWH